MAEAGEAVQSKKKKMGHFLCHKCNEEMSYVLEDFTCPKCKEGFIEKLTEIPRPNASQGASGNASGQRSNDPFRNVILTDPDLARIRDLSQELDGTAPGQSSRSTSGSGSGTWSREMNLSFMTEMDMHSIPNPVVSGGAGEGTQNPGQPAAAVSSMEINRPFSVLNYLFAGLHAGGGGVNVGERFPMIANFRDYAWGSGGLDVIITQLMNNLEGAGPPPMSTDKLERLPSVKISEDQVNRKLGCTVCFDDFQLNEEVKQLECDHVFHPNCIVPWLKLHGTCPICRKNFTTGEDPLARFEPTGQGNSNGHPDGQGGSGRAGRGNDLD